VPVKRLPDLRAGQAQHPASFVAHKSVLRLRSADFPHDRLKHGRYMWRTPQDGITEIIDEITVGLNIVLDHGGGRQFRSLLRMARHRDQVQNSSRCFENCMRSGRNRDGSLRL